MPPILDPPCPVIDRSMHENLSWKTAKTFGELNVGENSI